MKKYFKFTRLRESWKGLIVLMIIFVVDRFRNGHMSIGEIIITYFILTIIYVFATLVVDWVRMKNNDSKDKNSKE